MTSKKGTGIGIDLGQHILVLDVGNIIQLKL